MQDTTKPTQHRDKPDPVLDLVELWGQERVRLMSLMRRGGGHRALWEHRGGKGDLNLLWAGGSSVEDVTTEWPLNE